MDKRKNPYVGEIVQKKTQASRVPNTSPTSLYGAMAPKILGSSLLWSYNGRQMRLNYSLKS
jgi:hypothetical protein